MKFDIIDEYVLMKTSKLFAEQITPNRIYHYTSAIGLKSILQDKKLRFSKIDCLNDYKERLHTLDIYNTICNELLETKEITQEFYENIVDISLKDKSIFQTSDEDYSYEEANFFACCFSKNKDSLEMWNYYSKDSAYEGYNIYTQSIKTNLITKIKSAISDILTEYSFRFKKECFKHESEFRLVISLPKYNTSIVEYRISNGCLIPYVEVDFHEDFIMGITIGPLLNMELAEKGLRFYLDNYDYYDKSIYKSEIPIRY